MWAGAPVVRASKAGVCVGVRAASIVAVASAQTSAILTQAVWPWLGPVEEPVPCMDGIELARWEAANERCPYPVHAASPCRDCTDGFAAAMRFERRWSGRPDSDLFPPELAALRRWEVA